MNVKHDEMLYLQHCDNFYAACCLNPMSYFLGRPGELLFTIIYNGINPCGLFGSLAGDILEYFCVLVKILPSQPHPASNPHPGSPKTR